MSASSRPTGTTRASCATRPTTVGRPCGSLAVVTTPAGLCRRTYASACLSTRRPSTSTTSRAPTTVLSSPGSPFTRTRPALMSSSAPRREATPARARNELRRTCAILAPLGCCAPWRGSTTGRSRLAELAVFGANVQPGQLVGVTSYIGKEDLTRRIADIAYRRGAKYVDVLYFDQWVKRARIAHAADDTLDYAPPWMSQRLLHLSDEHAARITLSGPHAPRALDGLDPARAGRDLLPYLPETGEVVNAMTTSWTIVPAPTRAWAEAVYPELEPGRRVRAALGGRRAHLPPRRGRPLAGVARAHRGAEGQRAPPLTSAASTRSGCTAPAPISRSASSRPRRWEAGDFQTVDGKRHLPNIPTEETFTTPDPERVDGHVSATMPLELAGSIVSGIRVEFSGRPRGRDRRRRGRGRASLRRVLGRRRRAGSASSRSSTARAASGRSGPSSWTR